MINFGRCLESLLDAQWHFSGVKNDENSGIDHSGLAGWLAGAGLGWAGAGAGAGARATMLVNL